MYGVLGMDGATHIAEEVPHPGRAVPRILILIMLIGTGTAVPWAIAFMFSTNDLEAIATSPLPIYPDSCDILCGLDYRHILWSSGQLFRDIGQADMGLFPR